MYCRLSPMMRSQDDAPASRIQDNSFLFFDSSDFSYVCTYVCTTDRMVHGSVVGSADNRE